MYIHIYINIYSHMYIYVYICTSDQPSPPAASNRKSRERMSQLRCI